MPNRVRLLGQVLKAFKQLNPHNVAEEAKRQVRLCLAGPVELLQDAAAFLLGEQPEEFDRAGESLLLVSTPPDPGALSLLSRCDVVLLSQDYQDTLPGVSTRRIFRFSSKDDLPEVIKQILKRKDIAYVQLPLARLFPAFRAQVVVDTIQTVSVENAIFVTSTSLGNIIPNPLQALTSVAESLGDLVVLTANQIRMLFRIAAAYGREPGLKEQAPEALSIVGAAFGWRSIARELVSKIPMGAGVVPKAAIAFAGTWAIGESISYYYTTGQRLTREQLKERFDAAMVQGRALAEQFTGKMKTADEAVGRLKEAYARQVERLRKKPGVAESPRVGEPRSEEPPS